MSADHNSKHTYNRKNNRGSTRNGTKNDIRNNIKNGIGNNIRNECIGKSIRNNIRDHFDLYMTCCIPIIPFNLSAHMLLYLSSSYEGRIGGFGNVLLLLSGILLFVCLAIFRYSLKSYIRQRSEQYSILLMLGISGRDFWRNLAAEYCPAFFLLITGTAGVSSVAGDLLMLMAFRRIDADTLLLSVKITAMLILLFAAGMTGTLLLLAVRQWKKDLVSYLENLSHGKEVLHRFRIGYGMKILPAGFCLVSSCWLLHDYTVGKMIIAAFLHLTGIYFLLQVNGRLVRKVLTGNKKRYFRNLLKWNDFLYEYRMNGNLICAIYAVNFIMVFLFGGLLASDFPPDQGYTVIRLLFAVIGISVILEQQAFILGEMILDLRKEKERYDIFRQIGMEQNSYQCLIREKIKEMSIWPMAAASVAGMLFFLCDYIYQGDITTVKEIWSTVLAKYLCAVVVFWFVQYGGYRLLCRSVFRKWDAVICA